MTDVSAAADPVFTVDGVRAPDLARDCLAVVIEETTAGLRTCEAHFLATVPRRAPQSDVVEYLDGRTLDFGRDLSVSMGPPDLERVVFAGQISAIAVTFDEADAPHVSVLAEDALIALRQPRRSATYLRMTDAEVIRRVVSRHGFASSVQADGPSYPAVQQVNESDLGFLRDRAVRLGAEVWATGTTIHVATREERPGEAITLTRGNELISATARADLADQVSAVRVSGFDARSRERLDEQADRAALGNELRGGRNGLDLLEKSGRRVEQRTMTVPLGAGEARVVAESSLRARARRFVTVDGIAAATPQLAVASRLSLRRVGLPFSGDGYYVTRVRHVFARDTGGLRTHFCAERPELTTAASR